MDIKKDFKDISDELIRTYTFIQDGKYYFINIFNPTKLNVSASGGHRVLDADGISHYIPYKWIHLNWTVKKGRKPFEF